MPKISKVLLPGFVWIAAALRLPALFTNHYHADEALFSTWARFIAVWRDPLLANQLVDKPPLLFYLQASFYPLFGAVEWASRLPNFIASVLIIPLIAVFTWRLYRDSVAAFLAALIVALSPALIAYSATAFTDPLLASLIVLALLLVTKPVRPALSGLAFGLAISTKHQALLFLPLIFVLLFLQTKGKRPWRRWLVGFLPAIVGLLLWDIARPSSTLIWSNQIENFGGLRLIYSWELLPRLFAWLDQWQMTVGSPYLLILYFAMIIVILLNGLVTPSKTKTFDYALALFVSAYVAFHWLVAVPVWDRYLLPVLPLAALLLARAVIIVLSWLSRWLTSSRLDAQKESGHLLPLILSFLILLVLFAPVAGQARSGAWPSGGSSIADHGAWQIADYLADEPYRTVLYDHWYSWYWQYHFFDKAVYVSWFAHPTALAEDLRVFGDSAGSRYLVLPDAPVSQPVRRAIYDAGFMLEEKFRTDYQPGMILYRLKS